MDAPAIRPPIPEWLTNASYEELFLRGQAPRLLDQPNAKSLLEAVVASADVPPKLRVLANELLLDAGHAANPLLAEIYCRTLPDTFLHNAWGMPGHYTERLGKTLVSFGKAVLPCLVSLFEDQRRLGYFGSEEPSINAEMKYRVADLAAYFASQIAGLAYRDAPDLAERDLFLGELQARLRE